jgi:hypothetical protein
MIKPNENCWNEYYALVDVKNRDKVLAFTNKMSESNSKLYQEAKFNLKDRINGDIEVRIDNTSAFDYPTKCVIFKYFNSLNKFY